MFKGAIVYVAASSLFQRETWKKMLSSNGATVLKARNGMFKKVPLDKTVTHVVIDDGSVDQTSRTIALEKICGMLSLKTDMALVPSGIHMCSSKWLLDSVNAKSRLPESKFRVEILESESKESSAPNKKMKASLEGGGECTSSSSFSSSTSSSGANTIEASTSTDNNPGTGAMPAATGNGGEGGKDHLHKNASSLPFSSLAVQVSLKEL